VRRLTLAGVATTIAGTGVAGGANGPGAAATFSAPAGVAVSANGTLYVTEFSGFRVRALANDGAWTTTTLAGAGWTGYVDAVGTAAYFGNMHGIALVGTMLFVADGTNNKVRSIVIATGAVGTFAGGAAGAVDGTGTAALFN